MAWFRAIWAQEPQRHAGSRHGVGVRPGRAPHRASSAIRGRPVRAPRRVAEPGPLGRGLHHRGRQFDAPHGVPGVDLAPGARTGPVSSARSPRSARASGRRPGATTTAMRCRRSCRPAGCPGRVSRLAQHGLRCHNLRHSYATSLVTDGGPLNEIARVMGHEQISTTLDRCTHVLGRGADRVRESLADSCPGGRARD